MKRMHFREERRRSLPLDLCRILSGAKHEQYWPILLVKDSIQRDRRGQCILKIRNRCCNAKDQLTIELQHFNCPGCW